MDLNEIRVFVKVAQVQSFTAAARSLALPKSTVSHKVSALEKRLGITLIQRTTRKLKLTPAGQTYFERCLGALDALESAESEVTAGLGEVRGTLRLTAPVELGNSVLPALINEFLARHPLVGVDVSLTDRRVDLARENVDLALRAGPLADSSMIARLVGDVSFGVFASPGYLKSRGLPRRPTDLSRHPAILFAPLGPGPWILNGSHGRVEVTVQSRVTSSDMNLVKTLAVGGAGIALLPSFFCGEELSAKRLARLLPGWSTPVAPVHFVHPAQPFVPPRLTAFVALGVERLRPLLRP